MGAVVGKVVVVVEKMEEQGREEGGRTSMAESHFEE